MFCLYINQLINDDQFPFENGLFFCKGQTVELGSYFKIDFNLHLNFEMNSHNILVINITLEKLEKSLKYSPPQIISSIILKVVWKKMF